MMQKVMLVRVEKGRERYYKLSISKNLFGDFELDRVYGATRNKKPTRSLREFFGSLEDAVCFFNTTLKSKTAKGYIPFIS
jgi:predicted DNA-binding WGR domain protein